MNAGLFLLLLAPAAPNAPSYESLASEATPVNNLGRYLEDYLGDCDHDTPGFDKKGCESKQQTVQKQKNGDLIKIVVDDVRDQLSFAGWDDRKRAYRLHLTPLFPERDVALTVGKPRRLTADGRPILKNIPLWVELPKGEADFAFRRRLERGMVRLELLVRPKGPWKKAKGDETLRGLEVKLVGLRLLPARGAGQLYQQVYTR
ncbi:MAG: DUF6066 family protein [Deltaproteobacteria bacterium]|jgi:hypothetical protein